MKKAKLVYCFQEVTIFHKDNIIIIVCILVTYGNSTILIKQFLGFLFFLHAAALVKLYPYLSPIP